MWVFLAGLLSSVTLGQSSVEGLEDALEGIQARFPQSVSGDALYRAALLGVASHLGEQIGARQNRVLTQEEYEAAKSWLDGTRYGIGVESLTIPGRGMLLTEVFDGSPAAVAGLRNGDLVVSVDDHPFTGLPVAAIVGRIRQQRGGKSVFDVRRIDGTIGRVEVVHGPYHHHTVWMKQERDSLSVRVSYFGSGVAAEIAEALSAWDGAAVVLDLRDNPGGDIDEMVASADLFLDADAVIVGTSSGKAGGHNLMGSLAPSWTGNVAIVVNRGTAGVAEAFVAALQDHGRAKIVGTRTAGRGLQTSFYPAGRGLVLEIADTWLSSPAGRTWHGTGLKPDVFVEAQRLTLPVLHQPEPPDMQRDAAIRLISSGADER